MKKMFKSLVDIKPKHDLRYGLEIKLNDDPMIRFTIFVNDEIKNEIGSEYGCASIYIYSFISKKKRYKKIRKIKEILEDKEKAILFIKNN